MIDNTQLLEILNSRFACEPALKWLGKRNSDEMWDQCERPHWLLWWAAPYVSRQELVLVACQCARLALPYVVAGEFRPLTAIETAEAWTRGEATLEEVKIAVEAAHAAAYAAEVATNAYAANSAAYAAGVATAVAEQAACAIYAAAHPIGASARLRMCELIRQQWPTCPEPEAKG